MSEAILTLNSLCCGYSEPVVRVETLRINSGEFIILEGDNGCGKSTLIKTIMRKIKPLSGEISWGIPFVDAAYVPQDIELDPSIPATAIDIVLTASSMRGRKAYNAAVEALDKVGLYDECNSRYGKLSGGQRRRVLFARALLNSPTFLILDEPTVNMDRATEQKLGELLHRYVSEDNRTVLATTHVPEWVSHSKKLSISEGKLYE